jgi:hypothetical protein
MIMNKFQNYFTIQYKFTIIYEMNRKLKLIIKILVFIFGFLTYL